MGVVNGVTTNGSTSNNAVEANINGCTVNNVTIDNRASILGVTGGVIAVNVGEENDLGITNCEVNNLTASSNYAIGGILGCGPASIDSCTVNNPKITANYGVMPPYAIAGGAVGIAVENSELTNITVTADNSDSMICSDNLAGGIVGINSGRLSASSIANVIVKTLVKFIQNQATTPQEGETIDVEIGSSSSDEKCADAIQVKAKQSYEYCTDTNVTVIFGE